MGNIQEYLNAINSIKINDELQLTVRVTLKDIEARRLIQEVTLSFPSNKQRFKTYSALTPADVIQLTVATKDTFTDQIWNDYIFFKKKDFKILPLDTKISKSGDAKLIEIYNKLIWDRDNATLEELIPALFKNQFSQLKSQSEIRNKIFIKTQYADTKRWLGRGYNPNKFDIDKVNKELPKFKKWMNHWKK